MQGIICKHMLFWWKWPIPNWSGNWINARNFCYLYMYAVLIKIMPP